MKPALRLQWMVIVNGLTWAAHLSSLALAQTSLPAILTTAPAPVVVESLTPQQWSDTQQCVDRALAWMAARQRPDGSFPTIDSGQPGVTGLCTLAFLATGNLPGEGRYGPVIDKALEYMLKCQKPMGLITLLAPTMPVEVNNPSHAAMYNHAIAALCLSEAYGMIGERRNPRLKEAIELALKFTAQRRPLPKRRPGDEGGLRYAKAKPLPASDSDMSVTSWHLMFMRSARNAGFEVNTTHVDEALAYVERCYDPDTGAFLYALYSTERFTTRAMTAAGILSLSLGGKHGTPAARRAGEWLLRRPFNRFGQSVTPRDRFFYSAFYSSQAMFQLGGRYWQEFYPVLLQTLRANQRADGSWEPERGTESAFGTSYSTALATLALSAPYQLLPVWQR